MAFWRRRQHSNIYYLKPRPWYRRPRRPTLDRTRRPGYLGPKIKSLLQRGLDHFFYRTLGALAVLGGLLFVILSSALSIQDIEVVRENFNVDSGKVENSLQEYQGKSIVLTSRKAMAQKIMGSFPEFQSVIVSKRFPDKIQIRLESYPLVANLRAYHVKEKGPQPSSYEFSALNQAIQELARGSSAPASLRVIESQPPPTSPPSSDLPPESPPATEPPSDEPIEQKGMINAIGQAIFDQEENLELMTIVIRDLGRPILDREQVIPTEHIQYLMGSIDYFEKSLNVNVDNAVYFPVGREIHLKTKNRFSVWLTLEAPFAEQIDKLRAIYETAELNKVDLVYVDLRIREKVIYCPRDSVCRYQAD